MDHRLTLYPPRRGSHVPFPIAIHTPDVHQYFYQALASVAVSMGQVGLMGQVIMEVSCCGCDISLPDGQSLYWPLKIVEKAYNQTLGWIETQPALKAACDEINQAHRAGLH